jgi:hypothetical protein
VAPERHATTPALTESAVELAFLRERLATLAP